MRPNTACWPPPTCSICIMNYKSYGKFGALPSGLHSSLRRRLLAWASLSLAPALHGCKPATRPLVLAGHPWPGYECMFLARTLGYLPAGVQLRESPSLRASADAIRNGEVDGVMLTLDEVLKLRDQGMALQVVLIFNVSKGADVLLTRSSIQRPADLKDRTIGGEDSALSTLILSMVLEKAGLKPQDVRFLPVPYESQESAWRQDNLDALITYEPVASRLKAAGARQLLSTRDLPDTIFDVLALRTDALQRHGAALRATLDGYFRALTYLRQNPWDAAYKTVAHLGMSAEEMIASLRGLELPDLIGNQRYLSEGNGELQRITQKLSGILQQAGVVRQPVDPLHLYSGAWLPPATP